MHARPVCKKAINRAVRKKIAPRDAAAVVGAQSALFHASKHFCERDKADSFSQNGQRDRIGAARGKKTQSACARMRKTPILLLAHGNLGDVHQLLGRSGRICHLSGR